MLVKAVKRCDMCGDIVAQKEMIFFHTKKDFVTIREDKYDLFQETVDGTVPNKRHYCWECWDKIVKEARRVKE